MVTKELLAYLESTLKGGYQEEDLKKTLIAAGWNPQDVAEGFAALKGGGTAPTPTASAPATPTLKPASPTVTVVGPNNQPSVRLGNTSATLSKLAPQTSTLSGAKPTPPIHGRRWMMPAVIILVILLLGGGTAFAHFKGWITLPFFASDTRYEPSELLSGLVPKVLEIKAASYKVSFSLAGAPRDADAASLIIEIPELAERQPLYDRDAERFNELRSISFALEDYLFTHKNLYPAKLADAFPKTEAGNTFTDPSTSQAYGYVPTSDRKNFALTMAFETQEAIEAVKQGAERYPEATRASRTPLITEKQITFKKETLGYYYFSPRPARPMLVEAMESQTEYLNYLPGDFSFSLALSGAAMGEASQNVDARFQGAATFTMGDFAGSADAEFVRKDKTYYVRLNKFPSFFFDPIALKGKWVKITPDDIASNAGMWGSLFSDASLTMASTSEQRTAATLMQLRQFFEIAEEEKAFVATGGTKEQYEGKDVYRYRLAMDQAKIAGFYKRLSQTFESTYGDNTLITLDQKTVDYMESPAFQSVYNYFKNNGSLEVFTDAKSGYPVRILYQFRVVPDEKATKLRDRQFTLAVAVDLADINNLPAITAPADVLGFDDAQALLLGISKERFAFRKQSGVVRALRSALTTYKTLAGRYPESLADLNTTSEVIDAKYHLAPSSPTSSTVYARERYRTTPILAHVPLDAVSGAPFGYSTTASDYTLTYAIKLPPFREGNVAFLDAVEYVNANTKKLTEIFVEGKNTATSKILSQEAVTQAKVDADKDGISDALEAHFGTDPQKRDTDSDGKSDAEELTSRTNPSGVGPLEVGPGGSGSFFDF